jgi:predicted small secreted protein
MSKAKMRHQAAVVAAALAVSALLGGCGQIRGALGYDKDAPDEFQVVARAPLALPPNYDLRPPEPGTARPQELSPTDAAAQRILGRRAAPQATTSTSSVFGTSMSGPTVQAAPRAPVSSGGASALRDQLQLNQADPNIRQLVNKETASFVYEEQYPIDKVLFWRDKPEPGVLLDATKESKRLRENSALGQPVDTGETPTIERKRGGFLSGLF